MIRVEITNYESIEHAIIEIDGFTTVVGPNYSGKSAAMRAINAALTNQSGMEFVRWGQDYCEVRIQASDLDLLWHKEEGNNHYLVNGKKYSKIGRDEPPREVSQLGYGTVKVSGQKHDLHYADQFTPLFLVDDQNTKTADLVASVYGLDRLYKASELCSKDQRSNDSMLKVRKKDLENAKADLEKFDGFDDVLCKAKLIKEEYVEISKNRAQINQASSWARAISEVSVKCKKLKSVMDVNIPDSGRLTDDLRKYDHARDFLDRVSRLDMETASLKPAAETLIPNSGQLQDRVNELRRAKNLLSKLQEILSSESALRAIIDVTIPASLSDKLRASMEGVSTAKGYLESLKTGKLELSSLESRLSECSGELKKVEDERASFDRCPLCNQKLETA